MATERRQLCYFYILSGFPRFGTIQDKLVQGITIFAADRYYASFFRMLKLPMISFDSCKIPSVIFKKSEYFTHLVPSHNPRCKDIKKYNIFKLACCMFFLNPGRCKHKTDNQQRQVPVDNLCGFRSIFICFLRLSKKPPSS